MVRWLYWELSLVVEGEVVVDLLRSRALVEEAVEGVEEPTLL